MHLFFPFNYVYITTVDVLGAHVILQQISFPLPMEMDMEMDLNNPDESMIHVG